MYLKPSEEEKKLEAKIRSEVDKEVLWKHVEHICALGEKFSGTPAEKKTVDYIVNKLKEYNVPVKVHEFEAFLSYPSYDRSKDADLLVSSPVEMKVTCQSHAMSGSTEIMERELVDVGPGELSDYEGKDVKDKIVLVDFAALWAPERLWIAHEKGAAGQITISGDPVIHDMVVTTIWGTPTDKTADKIPRLPIVSVTYQDGLKLRELCKNNKVKVKMRVNIWRGWNKVYLPIVEIPGSEEPEKYFFIHGHYCSWGEGMTDNVGGNAQFIEMAKIFWNNRNKLKRGVKIAWWPGHSQGRYAGSTWYVDQFWEDIDKNCIGQMNIDSPGVIGAINFTSNSSSDLYYFNKSNIEEFSKEFVGSPFRISHNTLIFRAGDQSFTGIGIPRIGSNTDIPADSPLKGKTTGGGAGGWWWHTLQDTIDKGDKDLLARSMCVNVTTVTRLCNTNILPFNFEPVTEDYLNTLNELKDVAKDSFDFQVLIDKTITLKNESIKLEQFLQNYSSEDKKKIKEINNMLMKIAKVLISSYGTDTGQFDQDLAIRIPALPTLQKVRDLIKMNPKSSEYRFLKTGIIRQRNRILNALNQAIETCSKIQETC